MSLPVIILHLKLGPNDLVDIVRTRATNISHRYSTATYRVKLPVKVQAADWTGSKLIVRRRTRIEVRSSGRSGVIPVGFTFKQVRGTGDSDGTRNFPLASRKLGRESGQYVLACEDLYLDHGPAGAFRWKCCIVVQKKTGAIGIIDPHIENQN